MQNELYIVADAIKALRESRGLTQEQLAEKACKLRSNGMPVPLLRNCYSIFNGTKYR